MQSSSETEGSLTPENLSPVTPEHLSPVITPPRSFLITDLGANEEVNTGEFVCIFGTTIPQSPSSQMQEANQNMEVDLAYDSETDLLLQQYNTLQEELVQEQKKIQLQKLQDQIDEKKAKLQKVKQELEKVNNENSKLESDIISTQSRSQRLRELLSNRSATEINPSESMVAQKKS